MQPPNLIAPPLHQKTMPCKVNKAQLLLAIQATQSPQNLSIQRATQIYKVSRTILRQQLHRTQPQASKCNKHRLLTKSKEEELV